MVVLPALADAFESSVEVFALSALDEFALLEVLLSPADVHASQNSEKNIQNEIEQKTISINLNR